MIAFITGITGMSGSYLAEYLLSLGYIVHGLIRRSSSMNTWRIDHIYQDPHIAERKLFLHYGDITDSARLVQLLQEIKPDEIYHLAAQSHVRVSFDIPEYTAQVTGIGTLNLLEAVRRIKPDTRIYLALTSELFGNALAPQNEWTPFNPQSPYAISKLFSYEIGRNYRDAYGLNVSMGILFNHEGFRRTHNFVTKKVCQGAYNIYLKKQKKLYLGNLEAKRDWGLAPEFVQVMHLINNLRMDNVENTFVVGTGETHSVEEFVESAFSFLDLDYKNYVEIDPKYYRPTEVNVLQADYSKIKGILGWEPRFKFKDVVRFMMEGETNAGAKLPYSWMGRP